MDRVFQDPPQLHLILHELSYIDLNKFLHWQAGVCENSAPYSFLALEESSNGGNSGKPNQSIFYLFFWLRR